MPEKSDSTVTNRKSETLRLTRRQFIVMAGTASAAAVLAACGANPPAGTTPAAGGATSAPQVSTGGGDLSYLTWTNFVPEMDTELDRQCKEWGDKNKVNVKVEHININDIPTRRAAGVQSKVGPDLIWDTQNWAVLFKDSLVDISDLIDELGKALGGWYPFTEQFCKVEGKWRALPHGNSGSTFIYRTDWFKQNNLSVPTTWDEFLKVGTALKKFGKPVGQTLGHSYGDPPSFWYPWLWAHGGKEVEADGKTVAINSAETVAAVEKAVDLYKSALLEAGIAWDDSSNNRSYAAEEISVTCNGSSVYFVAGRDAAAGKEVGKRLYENSNHFKFPAGPKGTFNLAGGYYTGIMSYSKQVNGAKDLLRYLMTEANAFKFYDSGKGYLQGLAKKFEELSIFKTDPKMKPYLDNLTSGGQTWLGWPGPLSAAAYRVYNNYTVIDMFAKACAGEFKAKDAVAWAEGQLKGVYK